MVSSPGFNGGVTLVSLLALIMLLQGAPAGAGGAVATGQVRLADGSPVAAVRVAAVPAPPPNIKPSDGQNYYAVQTPVRVALTDNDGRYRLPNLPAGRYFIIAGMVGQATFYPSTANIEEATVVTSAAGSALDGLDITMRTPPGGRVTGRVTPAAGGAPGERAVLSGLRLGELIETPVRPDGTFDFGRLLPGEYLVSLLPPPPGLRSIPFRHADADLASLQFQRPVLRTVTGRIVAEKGALPASIVGFSTAESYVSSALNRDGTFTVQLQPGRHQVEVGGLPAGYGLLSVRAGSRDATDALTIGNDDVRDVVITLAVRRALPRLVGRIAGTERLTSPQVELTGPIVGSITVPLQKDGSFEVAALPPGLYRATIPQVPGFGPVVVVVTSTGGELSASLPPR
jgi:hypothetical protein